MKTLIITLVLQLFIIVPVFSQKKIDIQYSTGGEPKNFKVVTRNQLPHWLFIEGQRLVAMNALNPESPIKVGEKWFASKLMSMKILGNIAYVQSALDGLHIVDISDFNSINILSVIPGINLKNLTFFVQSNFMYLPKDSTGFDFYDISNPSNPQHINTWNSNYPVSIIGYQDKHLYIIEHTPVSTTPLPVKVLEIENNTTVVNIRTIEWYTSMPLNFIEEFTSFLEDIMIFNNWVYDISDSKNITILDSTSLRELYEPFATKIENGKIYIYHYLAPLSVGVSVYDPSDGLTFVNSLELGYQANQITISGETLFVMDGLFAKGILSIKNSIDLELAGHYTTLNTAIYPYVIGDYLLYSNFESLLTYDISNKSEPELVLTQEGMGFVFYNGTNQYSLNADKTGWVVSDLSDPSNPGAKVPVNTPSPAPNFGGLKINCDQAVEVSNDTVKVYDISNPTVISEIARYYALDVDILSVQVFPVYGNYIVEMQSPSKKVSLIEIGSGTRNKIKELHSDDDAQSLGHIEYQDSLLFLDYRRDNQTYIEVYDFSLPNHETQETKTFATSLQYKHPTSLHYDDGYLFISGQKNEDPPYTNHLYLYDVSDLNNPQQVAYLKDFGEPRYLFFQDGYLYQFSTGLQGDGIEIFLVLDENGTPIRKNVKKKMLPKNTAQTTFINGSYGYNFELGESSLLHRINGKVIK